MEEFLHCNGCNQTKHRDKFSAKKVSKTGKCSKCKDCHNEYNRTVWYPKNSDKQQKATREWEKRNKSYKISRDLKIPREEAEKFLKRGKDKCDICQSTKNLAFDHCHDSSIARGILCLPCNTLLGRLGDTPNDIKLTCERFIKYLETPITEHPNYLS